MSVSLDPRNDSRVTRFGRATQSCFNLRPTAGRPWPTPGALAPCPAASHLPSVPSQKYTSSSWALGGVPRRRARGPASSGRRGLVASEPPGATHSTARRAPEGRRRRSGAGRFSTRPQAPLGRPREARNYQANHWDRTLAGLGAPNGCWPWEAPCDLAGDLSPPPHAPSARLTSAGASSMVENRLGLRERRATAAGRARAALRPTTKTVPSAPLCRWPRGVKGPALHAAGPGVLRHAT
jgi:hypothetical protein